MRGTILLIVYVGLKGSEAEAICERLCVNNNCCCKATNHIEVIDEFEMMRLTCSGSMRFKETTGKWQISSPVTYL